MAVVEAISHDVAVVPRGTYAKDPDGIVIQNRSFRGRQFDIITASCCQLVLPCVIIMPNTYIHTYIHTYTHTVHTYIHTHCTYIHTYTLYIHTYIHTVHTYIHTHCTYIHTHILYIHTYIHTVHTYTHSVLVVLLKVCLWLLHQISVLIFTSEQQKSLRKRL